jgi:hypothetical protein
VVIGFSIEPPASSQADRTSPTMHAILRPNHPNLAVSSDKGTNGIDINAMNGG